MSWRVAQAEFSAVAESKSLMATEVSAKIQDSAGGGGVDDRADGWSPSIVKKIQVVFCIARGAVGAPPP